MDQRPNISIITPVYNGQETIGRCIASMLRQDYPRDRMEIIVVDNNSNDNTAKIIRQFPVNYISESKKGPSSARNSGARRAQGEFLIFFDADQIAHDDYLKNLLEGWEDRSWGAFAGKNVGVNSKGDWMGKYWTWEWNETTVKKERDRMPHFSGGLVALRKDVFDRLGGFDENMMTCEDIDMAWRMQKNLNLKIKYNLEAVSDHFERTSWRDILKREFNFGYGNFQLESKHKEFRRSIFVFFYFVLKRTVWGVGALFLEFIKSLAGKKTIGQNQLILLGIGACWANWLGQLRGSIERMYLQVK